MIKKEKKGKLIKGKVMKISSLKTVVVLVERSFRHPRYHKVMRRGKKYLVHSEKDVQEGDWVFIRKSRPISKRKHFVIEKVIKIK